MADPVQSILLNAYAAPVGAYDELTDGVRLRDHWRSLFDYMEAENIQPRLRRPASDWAAEHTRPWQHDALPFVMEDTEWRTLSQGLEQRARLLNALVADLYGQQKLFAERSLPPGLLYANPEFLLAAQGTCPPDDVYLHLIAFDLGRSPDGQWRVLANRTEAPIGLGFSLENRILTARAMNELFNRAGITRLSGFLGRYRRKLQALGRLARQTEENLTVILSNGPDAPDYFEHAYLGRYFGFPVVEGADLTVRDGGVYLKTLEGLKAIGAIARRIDSAASDPLECDPHSLAGTAGLLQVAASGNVMMANAIGSGVVENEATMAFLPGLSERLLGEELRLPSLATWWCGQPEEADHVLGNIDNLVLRSAFDRRPLITSTVSQYLAAEASTPKPTEVADAIREQPYAWVGREPIELSQAPYLSPEGNILAAPVTLRVFAAATDDGYELMPGGLARIATPTGDLSKDVWVTAAGTDAMRFPPVMSTDDRTDRTDTSSLARRSDRDLPSRSADNLFWLGRYMERAEGAAHVYRSLLQLVTESSASTRRLELATITSLLASLGYMTTRRARSITSSQGTIVGPALWNLLLDPDGANSMSRLIDHIYRTADHVRERLSSDAWRTFDRLARMPQDHTVGSLGEAVDLMDDIIAGLSALSGQISDNMIHSYGWRLLDLGRRIERGLFGLRVIRDLAVRQDPDEESRLDLLLEINDCRVAYNSRYQSAPRVATALDLLIADNTNPRSVIFQIERMREHLALMPLEDTSRGLSDSQHATLTVHNALTLARVDNLAAQVSRAGVRQDLRRLTMRLEETTLKVAEIVADTYFEHLPNRAR
jgi:uncharacterized circularly permuted ATP-grasp superfamily protein/uncharacterized alpha-E superfamily protein